MEFESMTSKGFCTDGSDQSGHKEPYFRIVTRKPRNLSKKGRAKAVKRTSKANSTLNKSKKVEFGKSYIVKKDGRFDPFPQLTEIIKEEPIDGSLGNGPITSHHEMIGGSISVTAEEVPMITKPLVIQVKLDDSLPSGRFGAGENETIYQECRNQLLDYNINVEPEVEINLDEIQSSSDLIKFENKIERYRCSLCSLVFSAISEVEMHLKLVHPSAITEETNRSKQMGDFNCLNCDQTFSSEANRDKHNLLMHIRNRVVSCPECSQACSNFRSLEKHLQSEHEKMTVVQCPLCSMEFVLESSLKHHKTIFHYRKPTRLLSRTSNSVQKKKNFKCPKCPKEFDTQRSVRFHNSRDHKGESFDCNLCNMKILTPTALQKHLAEVHKVGNLNYYTCTDCKSTFQLPQNLEEHYVEVHAKELDNLCYLCGDKFACVDMLRSHKRSHKAFSCSFCSLDFKKEENLEEHLRNIHERDLTAETRRLIRIEEEDFREDDLIEPILEIPPTSNDKETFSKVLEINADGSVCVTEEKINDKNKTVLVNSPENVDLENLFNGVMLKDLPKKMSCPICSKVLTTKFLRTHLRSHSGSFPHKCQICDKAYAQGTLLRKHMKNRHYSEFLKLGNKYPKKKLIKCEYCEQTFQDIIPLETHLWEHMDTKNYRCDECAMKFGMKINLVEHYKTHYFKEERECTVCHKSFKSVGYYREHVEKCLSNWLCEECGIHCNTRESYAKHQKLIHGNSSKIYKCDLCDKHFATKFNFRDHMITHTNESSFPCKYCSKSFKRIRPLKLHITKEHAQAGFTCNYCSLVFMSQVDLQIHKKVHRKETPCELCGMVYLSRHTLDNHVAVYHTESPDKNYICSFCSEIFDKQIDLKTHLDSHYSGEIFLCQVNHCHKVFKKESLLKSHMTRIHTSLEYFCHFCYKKFVLDVDLQTHLATHLNNSALKCLRCRFSTTSKTELQEHMLNHSEDPQFECSLCGIKLQQKTNIIKHIQTTHQILPADCADFVIMTSWICSFCDKVLTSSAATIKHIRQHSFHGIVAEGTLQTTRLSQPSPIPSLWDAILPSLKVQVKAEQNNEAIHIECWQCPSCFLMTDCEESVKKHLLSSSKCQETLLQVDQEPPPPPPPQSPPEDTIEEPDTVEGDQSLILMDNENLDVEENEMSDFLSQFMTDDDAGEFLFKMNNGQLPVSDICTTTSSTIDKIIEDSEDLQ